MILPDVNLLVYAFHRDQPEHSTYSPWLAQLAAGPTDLALVDVVLTGFLRVVTNPRIFQDAASLPEALEFTTALRDSPRARMLNPTRAAWVRFASIAAGDPMVRGNLVPDAWLASLAIAHGCQLATVDRGFARFPGLNWFDPGAR